MIIVDDEPLARERLRELVEERTDVTLVAEARNGQEAVVAVRCDHPDLLLLDVQMPELDGFGVLEALTSNERPSVVFVTAYDRYALRAFDVHALDYLLKPFDDARFHAALDRAVERHRQGGSAALTARLLALLRRIDPDETPADLKPDDPLDRIAVRTSSRWHLIEINDIDWIEGSGVYARLVVGEKSYLLRTSLSDLENRLDSDRFSRIHRSTIVQLDRVREVRPHAHGEFVLVLKDGTRLKVSRTYSDRIRTYLDRLS